MTKEEREALDIGLKAYMRDMAEMDKYAGEPDFQSNNMGYLDRMGALGTLSEQKPELMQRADMKELVANTTSEAFMCFMQSLRAIQKKVGPVTGTVAPQNTLNTVEYLVKEVSLMQKEAGIETLTKTQAEKFIKKAHDKLMKQSK